MVLELPPCSTFYPIPILLSFLSYSERSQPVFSLYFVFLYVQVSRYICMQRIFLFMFLTRYSFALRFLSFNIISRQSLYISSQRSSLVYSTTLLCMSLYSPYFAGMNNAALHSRVLRQLHIVGGAIPFDWHLLLGFLPFDWLLLLHQQHISSKANQKLLKFCIIHCSQTLVGFSKTY